MKYSLNCVGEDFAKKVLFNKQDSLVLISHPTGEKNRNMKQMYEQFCKKSEAEQLNKDLVMARYKGVNESAQYWVPESLPALVLFKKGNSN